MHFIYSSFESTFSLGSDVISRYWLKSALIRGGWVSLSANFRWKGTSPTNLRWYQNTRMITLSCGINILAAWSIVSSHSMRVTDRQTDRQNYDPQERASIAASRGNKSVQQSYTRRYEHVKASWSTNPTDTRASNISDMLIVRIGVWSFV